MIEAVLDTNVLVAGLRSRQGASHEILRLLREKKWKLVLSNTVLGEYHEILRREAGVLQLGHADVDAYLDVLCALADQRALTSEWQPAATDPDDEPFIQLAREARAAYLVTHNVRDVAGAERFGVRVVRPAEFLKPGPAGFGRGRTGKSVDGPNRCPGSLGATGRMERQRRHGHARQAGKPGEVRRNHGARARRAAHAGRRKGVTTRELQPGTSLAVPCHPRTFCMNLVMNGLSKDGYEFAGMNSDEIVMKKVLPR